MGQGSSEANIWEACEEGNMEKLEAQINAGIDVNGKDKHYTKEGWTPLLKACIHGHTNICMTLIEAGANIETKNTAGFTPLHIASKGGHTDTVQLLLERGANVNAKTKDGSTSLHLAACSGHNEVIFLLQDYGAKRDARDNEGKTAVDVAKDSETRAALRVLSRKISIRFTSEEQMAQIARSNHDNASTVTHSYDPNEQMDHDTETYSAEQSQAAAEHLLEMGIRHLHMSNLEHETSEEGHQVKSDQPLCEPGHERILPRSESAHVVITKNPVEIIFDTDESDNAATDKSDIAPEIAVLVEAETNPSPPSSTNENNKDLR